MSDTVSKAMDRLLARLNDPPNNEPDENTSGLTLEFRTIEREWKQAFKAESPEPTLKRLAAEIERQEGLLSDDAISEQFAGRAWEHVVGKSGCLMKIREIIEREYP